MAKFIPEGTLLTADVADTLKYEIASELGITSKIDTSTDYWGNVPSRDCGRVGGKIGGNMVKLMIKRAEEALARGQGPF
ncbi:alpha/beta-type small acid-soluble spore protein [Carboxydothermus pertinax]|uniref:Small acid-soluble spore protein n=1 Tax=Carboxydothermus pertinax TaxID=870242 RepID=A0A1L8CUB4_9THEO|nr:alpha/beta-type small acid-soluble spore protein [Carboxydothermus pertinax]GAV22525.1 small acid-soluble spore protein [Carboxydothermus pertinax]